MIDKFNQRKKREADAYKGENSESSQESKVSDDTLLRMMGDKVKWRKET